jgi:HEAT repeat protein
MFGVFTVAIALLGAVVVLIGSGIVGVRVFRQVRERRRAALAAGPRQALLAFVADNGEQGSHGLVAIPDDVWKAVEPGALRLLGKLRGEAHRALVSVFLRRGVARTALRDLRSRSRVRRARAAQVLGDLGLPEAVPEICLLLTDRHAEVRVVAVRALGRIGDPAAAWRLIAGLDQRDPVPSLLVTDALVQLGPEAEVTLSAALDHPQARVRVVCLDALGLLGAAASLPRIARVLRTDDTLEVRVAAAANLGRLGARSAVEPLTEAVSADRPAPVRAAAARALGELGAPAAVPALVALLDDREYRVAHEAGQALRRLGRTGLQALQTVLDTEAAQTTAAGRGAHAQPSTAASHAREALALASISEPIEGVPVGELTVAR